MSTGGGSVWNRGGAGRGGSSGRGRGRGSQNGGQTPEQPIVAPDDSVRPRQGAWSVVGGLQGRGGISESPTTTATAAPRLPSAWGNRGGSQGRGGQSQGPTGGRDNSAPLRQGAWGGRGGSSQQTLIAPGEVSQQALIAASEVSQSVGGESRGGEGTQDSVARKRPVSGEGRRGARRPTREERFDIVVSRPADVSAGSGKKGTSGTQIQLVSNFFPVVKKADWTMYQYRVDFNPEVEKTYDKKKLISSHKVSLGFYIFDGGSLYVSNRISPDPLELFSFRDSNTGDKVQITVRLVSQLDPTDSMYIHFYNIVVRNIMLQLNFEEIGRNYFDPSRAINMERDRLILWPGYKTSMRHHENQTLLCVEMTHKVLRQDSCLSIIRAANEDRQKISDELIGSVVLTTYNRKTYRVDDIDWSRSPKSTFEKKDGSQVSFFNYLTERYPNDVKTMDFNQPMLVSLPKKKDFHRGSTQANMLVPQFCLMTGLSDAMRAKHELTRALSSHLAVPPEKRMAVVNRLISDINKNPSIKSMMRQWDFEIGNKPVTLNARELPTEEMIFGNAKEKLARGGDFTNMCKKYPMYRVINLVKWAILVPGRNAEAANRLVTTIHELKGLGFQAGTPLIITLKQHYVNDYADGIERAVQELRDKLQMIVAIMPDYNNTDVYAVVKKKSCLELGVPSQCLLAKNTTNPGKFRSVCTKMLIQMNAKLGGQPWTVSIPLKALMVIGFDVYHCGKNKGRSVGALVASTNSDQSQYYSTVAFHNDREELATNLSSGVRKCLRAYYELNNHLPGRIIMYRDGVGDGQLTFVYNTELEQIQSAIRDVYDSFKMTLPKFSFLVVTKRINTRVFQPQQKSGIPENPPSGTVVDDVITLPERFDFYLIPQSVRVGSVSPTSYNVLKDEQGLPVDKLQLITFKLCHLYFNWSGTVAVPAPCQYAHKLAYLTGIALGNSADERLAHKLYYL